MEKKRLLISMHKLPSEILNVIKVKYPYGYNHHLKEIKGIDDKKLYVLPIETNDATYLVKVDFHKPTTSKEMEELYNEEEEFVEESDSLPSEEISIEDEDE